MRVIDAAPEWAKKEIQRALGERLMRGFATSHDDDLRRVREALEWLSLSIGTPPLPPIVDTSNSGRDLNPTGE